MTIAEEMVYSPEPRIKKPLLLLKCMFSDLLVSRELAWRLFIRDISSQYRQTFFGYLWAIIPSLVTSSIFILMSSSAILNVQDVGMPYPVFVLAGTVLFGVFSDAVNAPLRIVSASKSMLVKVNFPREALLLTSILSALFSSAIKLGLLAAVILTYRLEIEATAFLTLFPIFGLLFAGIVLGILIVPAGLLFQDVVYALTLGLNALMLVSPVAFPPPPSGLLSHVMNINPLTPLIMACRDLMLGEFGIYWTSVAGVFCVTMIVLLIGWVLFRLALPIVVERMGS